MITSSVFVLAALTMTGVYLKNLTTKSNDEEYSIDFTELESVEPQNLAKEENPIIQQEQLLQDDLVDNSILNNDLDYLPMEEAGSSLVEIPGLTDNTIEDDAELAALMEQDAKDLELALEEDATKNVATQNVTEIGRAHV